MEMQETVLSFADAQRRREAKAIDRQEPEGSLYTLMSALIDHLRATGAYDQKRKAKRGPRKR